MSFCIPLLRKRSSMWPSNILHTVHTVHTLLSKIDANRATYSLRSKMVFLTSIHFDCRLFELTVSIKQFLLSVDSLYFDQNARLDKTEKWFFDISQKISKFQKTREIQFQEEETATSDWFYRQFTVYYYTICTHWRGVEPVIN